MPWTRPLRDVTLDDVASVGGKNASLGEMLRELVPLGVRVPDGFAVTADAYRALMRESRVDAFVRDELASLRPGNIEELTRCSDRIRAAIARAPLPQAIATEISRAYAALSRQYGEDATDVAVRSSATAEDLPEASFAGAVVLRTEAKSRIDARSTKRLISLAIMCIPTMWRVPIASPRL